MVRKNIFEKVFIVFHLLPKFWYWNCPYISRGAKKSIKINMEVKLWNLMNGLISGQTLTSSTM